MSAQRFTFVCVQTIFLIHVLVSGIASANEKKCEVLTIPMCKNLGYQTTYMPNRFNHKTQKDAALEIDKFSPFVKAGCSPMLQLFLCALYAPPCDKDSVNGKELLPCRSVCENATAGCLLIMVDYGAKLPWKVESCDLWPSKSDDKTCLSGLDIRSAHSRSSFTLSGKTRSWLTVKDKILTTVTVKNSDVSFLRLKNIVVTLMLLKNTSVSFFDLIDANVNLLTLESADVAHFTLTNIFRGSLTLMNTTISYMTMRNNTLNSLMLMNTNISFLTIINTNMTSFTLINCRVSFLRLTNTTVNSFARTNSRVSSIRLTNSNLSSQPPTNSIAVTTEMPSTNNHSTSTKSNFGVIIVVSKFQISAYFVLLFSINGFFA